jgi:hypothetical protein
MSTSSYLISAGIPKTKVVQICFHYFLICLIAIMTRRIILERNFPVYDQTKSRFHPRRRSFDREQVADQFSAVKNRLTYLLLFLSWT